MFLIWEDDVPPDEHRALAVLFSRCFPRTSFAGRSWSSGRPELRLIGRDGARVVAHLGVLRRFLQVDGRAQLVGDVGLVAVDPAVQGRGVGARLRRPRRGGAARAGRAVRVPHLRRSRRRLLRPRRLGARRRSTRMVRSDGTVQVYGGASMVLAVRAPVRDWPAGQVDRNGVEV